MPNDLLGPTPEEVQVWLRFPAPPRPARPGPVTMTGRPPAVVLEAGVGGRIYERTADGAEHEWGEVTVWQPPDRLAYLWYLGRDRAEATEVEIRFLAQGTEATRVEIEHRGWERLSPPTARSWRDRNQANWQTLLPHFIKAITEGEQ